MGSSLKWFSIALILVTAAALAVAFGSSTKARISGQELKTLRAQVRSLTEAKTGLQEDVIRVRSQQEELAAAAEGLKQELERQKQENQRLSGLLQGQDRRTRDYGKETVAAAKSEEELPAADDKGKRAPPQASQNFSGKTGN
ncbi:MAG: hypothetical protein NC819_02775 [Candidatus Omnitrophica bacterium]|nr:hypothetical protein [Candidatus Omnitrophota bacterium]